jgi:cytochrome b561
MTVSRYTKTAVVLHWLIAFGLLVMFILGWYMAELPKDSPKLPAIDLFDLGIYSFQLEEPASVRGFYFNLHKSIGVTLLVLIAFRIFWRLTHQPPALLATMKAWESKLAGLGHKALYVLMIATPISGLIMASYSKYGVRWFGLPLIPGLDDKVMRENLVEVHELVGIILLVVIAVHVLGALKHKFIEKDETMKRMTLHG